MNDNQAMIKIMNVFFTGATTFSLAKININKIAKHL